MADDVRNDKDSYDMRTTSLLIANVLSTELIDDNNHSEHYYDLHLSLSLKLLSDTTVESVLGVARLL